MGTHEKLGGESDYLYLLPGLNDMLAGART